MFFWRTEDSRWPGVREIVGIITKIEGVWDEECLSESKQECGWKIGGKQTSCGTCMEGTEGLELACGWKKPGRKLGVVWSR